MFSERRNENQEIKEFFNFAFKIFNCEFQKGYILSIVNCQLLIFNSRREGFTPLEKKPYPNSLTGFTLIEVLLSLMIVTIILGAVYGSFFTVQHAIERFDGISLKYHEARTALDLMRREIERARLEGSFPSNSDSNKTIFIIKDRDIYERSASGLQLSALSFKGGGLKSILYFINEKDNKLALLRIEMPSSDLLIEEPDVESLPDKAYISEMIEDIESFTVETLFNDKWVRTWDTRETGALPDTVRFSIEFNDSGKKIKLTEYAKPKIGRQL